MTTWPSVPTPQHLKREADEARQLIFVLRRIIMHTNPHKSPCRTSLTVLALAILTLFQVTGYAQTDQGRIVGTVVDANGGLVPGASVVVKNERTGEERTTTTNES
jgi:hypothetical protein